MNSIFKLFSFAALATVTLAEGIEHDNELAVHQEKVLYPAMPQWAPDVEYEHVVHILLHFHQEYLWHAEDNHDEQITKNQLYRRLQQVIFPIKKERELGGW